MATKREFEAQLRYMKNPPPMSMEKALAAENPIFEILIRITGHPDDFTPAESMFWQAHHFHGDTMNGGLLQTLNNSTGAMTDTTHQFIKGYCDSSLDQLFSEIKALFPDHTIPKDHKQRITIIETLSDDWEEFDPFEKLTQQFWKLQEVFDQGLLKLATERRTEFRGLQGKVPPTQHQPSVSR